MKGNIKIRQGTNLTVQQSYTKKLLIHFISNEVILLE